ncbi:MAG TPA: methylenetetrahydrofolate reductase [NAD(P)H] [Luteibaculaceae bacterium]|nr:methylenetetrahydrofolate reductase [NAD(P)H] [Luteibaculaceae bacterium]
MKVIDHLKAAKKTLFSFELLPPLKGASIQTIFDGIEPLLEFDPKFINVTYHREEYLYKTLPGGYLQKYAIRKRPGTVSICAAIQNKFHIDTVPHLICGGFSKEETENALIELQFLGIDNILALRGDPVKTESTFVPSPGGHRYAWELIEQINNMNSGKFLHDEKYVNAPTNFCIGAAGYPEKHFEALNLKTDLTNLHKKVECGAEYVVTQLFYDNQKYFDYVDQCRKAGINVPIIPGIKVITTLKHIQFIPKTFHVDFPDALADQLMRCTTDAEVKEVGIAWGIQQTKELIERGVPCLHFYTMGKADEVRQIVKEVL